MTTLVTGVGLVGTSFAEKAIERHEKLIFVDSESRADYLKEKLGNTDVAFLRQDIRDLPALVQTMSEYHIDTVVHTAGLIGARVADPLYTGLQINMGGTMNVAEAVRLTGVKRLVHISTFGVYDRNREGDDPITEDFPLGGTAAYSASKVANELLVNVYSKQYGFELIVLRPANVYGVGHFWAGSGGGQTVQSVIEAGITGEKLGLPAARDFEYVYAKDVGRAIDLAATIDYPEQNHFNVGNGRVTTFAELVEAAKAVLPKLDIDILPPPTAALQIRQPMDLSASKKYLGWEPQYSLEAGFIDYAGELTPLLASSRWQSKS